MSTFTNVHTFTVLECCTCGTQFGITSTLNRRLLDSHDWFCCPHGHQQRFTGKTEAQKLEEQLDRERRSKQWLREERDAARSLAEHERHRANGYKGALTKTKKRIGRGVCPCCNRSFPDLAAHMSTKHPTYAPEDTDA